MVIVRKRPPVKRGRIIRTLAWTFLIGASALGMTERPAGAADAAGCSGSVTSTASGGRALDTASAPGTGGTKSRPLLIDRRGSVSFTGTTDQVLSNGRWSVDIGIPFVPRAVGGSVKNSSGLQTWSRTERVAKRVPSGLTGLYKVKFKITGAGGAPCRGNLWIEIVGSPLFKPIWLGALALVALGAWGIVVEVLSLVGGA